MFLCSRDYDSFRISDSKRPGLPLGAGDDDGGGAGDSARFGLSNKETSVGLYVFSKYGKDLAGDGISLYI